MMLIPLTQGKAALVDDERKRFQKVGRYTKRAFR